MGGFMKCLLCLLRALFWDRRGGLNGGFYEVLVMFASCFVLGQEGGLEWGGFYEVLVMFASCFVLGQEGGLEWGVL